MGAELNKTALAALASGHLATDFANGALPALLPFLVERFDLSYTLAAVVMLASTASSSIVQPFFGLWSDGTLGVRSRRSNHSYPGRLPDPGRLPASAVPASSSASVWLLPCGVAVAGIGMALAADAPTYWLVLLLVVVSGLGVAAYHPEGSKFAAYASGARRASGMSAFSIGGNIGYALGPTVATPLVLAFGLRGGFLLAVPCLAIAALLLAATPFLRSLAPAAESAAGPAGQDRPGALAVLLGVIALRSVAWFGLVTFVPLWEVSLGHPKAYGNHLLSAMLLAGGLGTVVAGPAADRLGRRPVLLVSMAAIAPLAVVFLAVGGVVGAIALALVGVCVIGTFGVTMVMSQEYLPRQIGLASGLSIGLSIGVGGIAAVGLGALADSIDLETALYVCAGAPIAGVALALLLPSSHAGARLSAEPVAP